MDSVWERRVAEFWESADDSKIEQTLSAMKALVDELGPDDPNGVFEWAGVHDYLGLEEQAIPLYFRALELGLTGQKREMAVIQLASSMRNVGRNDEAIALLEATTFSDKTRPAARAFLALALFDAGKKERSLRQVLEDFFPSDALYGRSIRFYAQDLTERNK